MLKLPYVLPGDKVSDYPPISKQSAEAIEAMLSKQKINITTWTGTADANYLNQTISFGFTFKAPPTVILVNKSGSTLILYRVLNTTNTAVSLQFQTPNGAKLGPMTWTIIAIGEQA